MRYTRYNYKKKKNNDILKFILSFVGMSVFVIIVGILLANIIIHFLPLNNASTGEAPVSKDQVQSEDSKNVETDGLNEGQDAQVNANINEETNNSEEVSQGAINTNFIAIQCGYFSEEDNAKVAFNQISNGYGAFIYNDEGKFKVLAGVYTGEEGQDVIEKLSGQGIKCYEVTFNLNSSNAIEGQIAGIYNGYLEILNIAFKDDVGLFDTSDFKEWVSKLEEINEGDKSDILLDLKKHISELPVEIKKEDVASEMEYLYKVLLNFNK